MSLVRNPLLPIGVLLVLLGLGNWYAGHGKTVEHQLLLTDAQPPAPSQHFDEFRELDARTNATLLRRLQGDSDESTIIRAKLDFYQVVQSGGRMLMLLGLFSVAAGMIHSWYRQRVSERGRTASRGV